MKRVKLCLLHKTDGEVVNRIYHRGLIILMMLFAWVHAQTNVTFERNPTQYPVFEGNPVFLECDLNTRAPVSIIHNEDAIVHDSVLLGLPSKYALSTTISNNVHTLTIYQIDRHDGGLYFCRAEIFNIKELNLNVYYWPKREPVCKSSLQFSAIFFEDMLNDEFQFNCTVEDGNPASNAVIYWESGTKDKFELNAVVVNGSEGNVPRRILTYSSRLNNSYSSSSFACEVSQKMPTPLEEYDYERYCQYGPISYFKNLETLVNPRNVSIKQGESVSLICSSNVDVAEKRWITNFSDGVTKEISKKGNDIHLTLAVLEGQNQISVVCESLFGQRNSSAVAQIHVTPNKQNQFPTLLIVVVLLIIITTLVVIVVVRRCLLKSSAQSSSVTTDGECMEHMVAT